MTKTNLCQIFAGIELVSDVIIQVDKCLQPLGHNLRDRAVRAMAGELEDCAQASLLMFMMNACQDADYLDKVSEKFLGPFMRKIELLDRATRVRTQSWSCTKCLFEYFIINILLFIEFIKTLTLCIYRMEYI